MKSTKAISMISLIIIIVLMIILASISGYYLTSTINDAEYKDVKEDIRNIENVVEYAKTQILINEFTPNENFLISDVDLENKFGNVLTSEEKDLIKTTNSDTTKKASEKYYLMNQKSFDAEFGNDFNISNLRNQREFLVNYMDTVVVCNFGGKLIASKNIIQSAPVEEGELRVVFEPDGNPEWQKSHQARITLYSSNVTIEEANYVWSQSYTTPSDSEFSSAYGGIVNDSGTTVLELKSETGNDWYLWIRIKYTENGREKVHITKSRAFALDNEEPTATLELEGISI